MVDEHGDELASKIWDGLSVWTELGIEFEPGDEPFSDTMPAERFDVVPLPGSFGGWVRQPDDERGFHVHDVIRKFRWRDVSLRAVDAVKCRNGTEGFHRSLPAQQL